MIGNYVYNTHNRQCEQVQGIHDELVMLDYNDLYKYDDIEPIPLWKLHLTKNGFVADEKDMEFVFNDGYEIKVIFDNGIKSIGVEPSIFLIIEFAEKALKMEIKYVHELQNAMQLFGVEKKITL